LSLRITSSNSFCFLSTFSLTFLVAFCAFSTTQLTCSLSGIILFLISQSDGVFESTELKSEVYDILKSIQRDISNTQANIKSVESGHTNTSEFPYILKKPEYVG